MEFATPSSIELRLYGGALDVPKLSSLLGQEPLVQRKKGDKGAIDAPSSSKDGSCVFELKKRQELALNETLTELEPSLAKLAEDIKAVREAWLVILLYDPDFIGLVLEPERLGFLTRLNIGLSVENRAVS